MPRVMHRVPRACDPILGRAGGRQEMFCVCSIQLLRHAAAVTTVTSPADMEAVLEDVQNREYNTAHKVVSCIEYACLKRSSNEGKF